MGKKELWLTNALPMASRNSKKAPTLQSDAFAPPQALFARSPWRLEIIKILFTGVVAAAGAYFGVRYQNVIWKQQQSEQRRAEALEGKKRLLSDWVAAVTSFGHISEQYNRTLFAELTELSILSKDERKADPVDLLSKTKHLFQQITDEHSRLSGIAATALVSFDPPLQKEVAEFMVFVNSNLYHNSLTDEFERDWINLSLSRSDWIAAKLKKHDGAEVSKIAKEYTERSTQLMLEMRDAIERDRQLMDSAH